MPQTQNSQKPIIESRLKSLPELQTMGLGRAQHNKLKTMAHTILGYLYIKEGSLLALPTKARILCLDSL
jgi:hypothetical protein